MAIRFPDSVPPVKPGVDSALDGSLIISRSAVSDARDSLRPDASEAYMAALRESGLRILMLTGDSAVHSSAPIANPGRE